MTPVLYSFRRCPYAMRARLAIAVAEVPVRLREVVLRDKPAAMLEASPKGTVPVLVLADGLVIDESLDVMRWALSIRDPGGWLQQDSAADALIAHADGPFKQALDRTKYATRYPGEDSAQNRQAAARFLHQLDARLTGNDWLTGAAPRLVDMAILPFVRQFAAIDQTWFAAQPWPRLAAWLARFVASDRLDGVMRKYPRWHPTEPDFPFPEGACHAS